MAETPEGDQRGSLDLLVGNVVAEKYRVDRLIGRGGMGAVFQATNVTIGKRVALKFLDRDATRDRDAFERFQREALAASVVESAHIVQLFDSGTSEDGRPFLVMELLSGEDLRARLRREGKLPVDVAVALAKQILRALVRAHGAGIVHRDLKPDNVFLCERDDGALFVKIVDFGISKLISGGTLDTLTRRGTVLGTAYYMSPEQAQAFGDVDGRTDLFSVGAILFECLTGRPPHVGPTYEAVLIAICTKDAEDVRALAPEVPLELASSVCKALARERAERFQSAAEFLAALNAFAPNASDVVDSSSRPRSTSEVVIGPDAPALSSTSRTQDGRQRARSWIAGGAALLLGFALTAFWMGNRRTQPIAPPPTAVAATPVIGAELVAIPAVPASASAAAPPVSAIADVALLPSVEPSADVSGASGEAVKGQRGHSRAPKPATPSHTGRQRAAVAPGLELSTREP
jgi:serine/threonine protein kinase